jgi:DNA-binding response OmpR family regulator
MMSSSETKARPTILVIEDEPGLLEILAVNLESSGYRAVTAADGIEAWRRFEEEQPDLILLDLKLPEISGFRLLELFRDSSETIPVIVLTAFDFAEAEEVSRFGVQGFITKPFTPEKVVEMVGDFLSQRRW